LDEKAASEKDLSFYVAKRSNAGRIDLSEKSVIINAKHIPLLVLEVRQMKQCMDADNLHRRLKKIIGQVQAIDRMIDEDVPCEDILSQLNAAKSALHKCGQVVLEGHIKHCVKDGLEHGDADKTIEDFTKAVERFANMG
jgi:DNA-binding FrmR family transcriptional regulator